MFDFTNVKSNSFEPVPAGHYLVISDNVEVKTTAKGGEYVLVKYKILEGENAGRFIFDNYNIKNENVKAVEIGLSKLKNFIECSKAPLNLSSWVDLVGYRATAVTKIRSDATYGDKAVISYFKEISAESLNKDLSSDIPF